MAIERLRENFNGPNHKWWALAAVGVGVLMATLDSGIVAVSLPTIMTQFHADVMTIQWVILAYLLVITVSLLPFGRLADIRGRKQIYIAGMVVFAVGSALCGAAANAEQLIAFRALQALGAAMLMANGMAITSAVFPASERGKALGIQGTVVATGITIGPTIGGLLTEWLGWRSVFYVNLPICVVGVILAALALHESEVTIRIAGRRPKFDLPGAAITAVGLLALLIALSGVDQVGLQPEATPVLYGLAACALVAFVVVERRVAEPIIDLSLFRLPQFTFGSSTSLLTFLAVSANGFLLPFYLQLVLGFPPGQAGLLMTPTTLAIAFIAPISGWLSDRVGARILSSAGLATTCLALLSLSRLDSHSGYGDVLLRLLFLGVGQGLFQSPNNSSVIGAVPRERYGVAGGFLSMMRNLGMVTGTALGTSILATALAGEVGHANLNMLVDFGMSTADRSGILAGFMTGMERAYLVSAAIAALGIFTSLARGKRQEPRQATASGKPESVPSPAAVVGGSKQRE